MEAGPGAIDGISYSGLAEPKARADFMQMENLPEMFRTVAVRFLLEDGRVIERRVTPGGGLKASQIPAVPDKVGCSGVWDGLEAADLESILFNMTFEALYTEHSATIQSEQNGKNGLPVLLVEGSFTDLAVASVEETDAVPALGKQEILLGSWTITMNEPGNVARLLLPEGEEGKKINLYVSEQENVWREVSFRMDGSYLVFPVTSDHIDVALVRRQADSWAAVIAVLGVLLLFAGIVAVRSIRNRAKAGKLSQKPGTKGEM